jgi:hypothetical protein
VARNQAEAHVGIMADMMGSHFATTQDLANLRADISRDMLQLRSEIRQDMTSLRSEVSQDMIKIRAEMQNLEHRLTIKLGTIVAGSIGISATIMTLVIKLA